MKKLISKILGFTFLVLIVGCSPNYDEVDNSGIDASDGDVVDTVDNTTDEYGINARTYLEGLINIGTRASGTEEEYQAARYITNVFSEFGYETENQSFTAKSEDGETIESSNVIAVKDGESGQVIVVGAHYDGVDDGRAADDNASGVAVMLEVAGLVQAKNVPYTIYFVAFGGEEAGLLGSYAFVSSMSSSDLENIILMVNLDSISVGDNTYAYGPESASSARDWVLNWAETNGYDLETIWNVNLADEEGYATADYAAFDEAGIPWLYFEATDWTLGNEDGYTQVDPQYGDNGAIIHTQYDDLDYFDEVFPGRVDEHFNLYVDVLNHLLTEFVIP